MSDYHSIGPVPAVTSTAPAPRVQANAAGSEREQAIALRQASGIAASTGGSLRPAAAQLVVHPTSHELIICISDAVTHTVIAQLTSPEVEAMTGDMRRYADAAARRRTGKQS
jgi:hypothetical protein